MRLIDADALLPMMKYATIDNEIGVFPIKIGFNAIAKVINEAPTVDAEPVRHGRWIPVEDDDMFCYCSECGTHEYKETIEVLHYDYCPYCGAKMDEENDNETG